MKRLSSLLLFLLLICLFSFVNSASANTVYFGETKTATYDLSIPGSKLLWTQPLNDGGMNLKIGEMTKEKDADIAFSPNGDEFGAKKLIDLGAVNFNNVYQRQQPSGGLFEELVVKAVKGHVYMFELSDGTLAKLYIESITSSEVKFKYALEEQPPQQIKFKEKLKYSTKPITLKVIASFPDNTTREVENLVEWKSSNPNVAKVKDGVVTFTGNPGTVSITAKYNGKEVKVTVTVGNSLKTLSTSTKFSYSTKPITINLTATYTDGTEKKISSGVTWKSSNTTIAKVSSKGVVTFTGKPGKVTITGTYQGKTVTLTTTVPNKLKTASTTTKLAYNNKPIKINFYGTYMDGTKKKITSGIKWKSSNTKVAKVNSKGIVTFTGKTGTVIITGTYQGKKVTLKTTVKNDTIKSISTTTKLAYSSKPITINVTATYLNGKKVKIKSGIKWKSSNTKVAKVNSKGVVTFTGANGDVTITGTYKDQKITLKTTVKRVDKFYGKWKIWIPGSIVGDYYIFGTSGGTLTINKDGTYKLGDREGNWRVAKSNEVYNHPVAIILKKAGLTGEDVAVTNHDSKSGYIKLLVDIGGTYTDGSKIWVFQAEGYK